jgi:hypothetical protein
MSIFEKIRGWRNAWWHSKSSDGAVDRSSYRFLMIGGGKLLPCNNRAERGWKHQRSWPVTNCMQRVESTRPLGFFLHQLRPLPGVMHTTRFTGGHSGVRSRARLARTQPSRGIFRLFSCSFFPRSVQERPPFQLSPPCSAGVVCVGQPCAGARRSIWWSVWRSKGPRFRLVPSHGGCNHYFVDTTPCTIFLDNLVFTPAITAGSSYGIAWRN